MALIEAKDLTIGYFPKKGHRHAVAEGVNVTLREGELVCLLGPNGAGKSTLLRTLSAMQAPLGGKILLDGQDIHRLPPRELARILSVVLTERVTAGLMTSYALVSLGRYPYTDWVGRLTDRDHEIVRRAIDCVGAADLTERNISELSDGERQKVMMARALAQQPKLMILDEITAFLDLPRRVDIMRILRRLAREEGCAIVLSTHDLDLALRAADRVWLLPKATGGRPARLEVGAPEDLVLNGKFEAAFSSEGVDFDREVGHFSMHDQTAGEIVLDGDGLAANWTRKALTRLGYSVVAESDMAAARVEVSSMNGRHDWVLAMNGALERLANIEDLTRAIRRQSAN